MIGGEENDALFDRVALHKRIADLEEYNIAQGEALRKLRAENEQLKQFWFSDADPRETPFAQMFADRFKEDRSAK